MKLFRWNCKFDSMAVFAAVTSVEPTNRNRDILLCDTHAIYVEMSMIWWIFTANFWQSHGICLENSCNPLTKINSNKCQSKQNLLGSLFLMVVFFLNHVSFSVSLNCCYCKSDVQNYSWDQRNRFTFYVALSIERCIKLSKNNDTNTIPSCVAASEVIVTNERSFGGNWYLYGWTYLQNLPTFYIIQWYQRARSLVKVFANPCHKTANFTLRQNTFLASEKSTTKKCFGMSTIKNMSSLVLPTIFIMAHNKEKKKRILQLR